MIKEDYFTENHFKSLLLEMTKIAEQIAEEITNVSIDDEFKKNITKLIINKMGKFLYTAFDYAKKHPELVFDGEREENDR